MANKTADGKFECSYCGKLHDTLTESNTHKSTHDLLYVALTLEDIRSLINFLYSKDEKVLQQSAVQQLLKYRSHTQRLK
jgi:hypothetical protein